MSNGPDAVIFDLDGVITFTARVHAAAWKELFDDFLRERAAGSKQGFRPFQERDYYEYIDGKPRYDGVSSFLESRDIDIPYGSASDDSPSTTTIRGLGNRKNELFNQKLQQMGVDVDHKAINFVRALRRHGVRTGVASSSKNAGVILDKAGIEGLFDAVVDGVISENLGLRGKPQPDIFLLCLSQLTQQVDPQRAAIVEDAIAGIEAGRLGGFGLVLGVDRGGSGALTRQGADWVIRGFDEITVAQLLSFFANRKRAA